MPSSTGILNGPPQSYSEASEEKEIPTQYPNEKSINVRVTDINSSDTKSHPEELNCQTDEEEWNLDDAQDSLIITSPASQIHDLDALERQFLSNHTLSPTLSQPRSRYPFPSYFPSAAPKTVPAASFALTLPPSPNTASTNQPGPPSSTPSKNPPQQTPG